MNKQHNHKQAENHITRLIHYKYYKQHQNNIKIKIIKHI